MLNKELVVEMMRDNSVKKPSERKVWSIGLETTLVPYFVATNASGITKIDRDAIGAPLRLARNKEDNTVRTNSKGRLIIQVAKPISDAVKVMRENYVASLNQFATSVKAENEQAYTTEAKACIDAGKPIVNTDKAQIAKHNEAIRKANLEAIAKQQAEAEEAKQQAEAIVKAGNKAGKDKVKA